jgi:hypothetical protein
MPDLSDEERIRRQQPIDFARGSVLLSGGGLDAEVEALNARYVAGEMSDDEHVAAVIAHARTLPTGEPEQEYFSSLKDAINAVPGR